MPRTACLSFARGARAPEQEKMATAGDPCAWKRERERKRAAHRTPRRRPPLRARTEAGTDSDLGHSLSRKKTGNVEKRKTGAVGPSSRVCDGLFGGLRAARGTCKTRGGGRMCLVISTQKKVSRAQCLGFGSGGGTGRDRAALAVDDSCRAHCRDRGRGGAGRQHQGLVRARQSRPGRRRALGPVAREMAEGTNFGG